MTVSFMQFGEQRPEYAIPVFNERAVRAAAGILLVWGLIAFMHAFLQGNFLPTKIFVAAFLIDFTIRLFINPKFAPSLIVGQWIVRNQTPEYTGAPQKRFAWGIGFVLALAMFYLMVWNSLIGPINGLVCLTCLTLMFFESAFGICLGCKLYNLFNKEQAKLCPGNSCDLQQVKGNQVRPMQWVALLLALGLFAGITNHSSLFASGDVRMMSLPAMQGQQIDSSAGDCQVPDWAVSIGHEDMWKAHNGCD